MKTKISTNMIIGLVLILLGFTAGFLVGPHVRRINEFQNVMQQVAEKDAGQIMIHSEVLSRLRLGESDSAIRLLETTLDGEILSVDQKAKGPLLRLSDYSKKALQAAKTYRAMYPSISVKGVLKEVSDLKFDKECDSGLCRLYERKFPRSDDKE